MDCLKCSKFEQEKYRNINIWNAIGNLRLEYDISADDLLHSFMGWQGDHDVREWIIGRVEKDYSVTFDKDGNMTDNE